MTGLTQELTQSGPAITRVPAVEPVEHRIVRSTTKRAIDVLLAGTGLAVLWPEAVLLLCFSAGIMWLSASRFEEKLG